MNCVADEMVSEPHTEGFVLTENQTELRGMEVLSMWQSRRTERHPFSAISQNETASFIKRKLNAESCRTSRKKQSIIVI